jgi:hypothetical protein
VTDWSRIDLYWTASYAIVAERHGREAQESLAHAAGNGSMSANERLEATFRATSEASLAAVALYLGAISAQRFCSRDDMPAPPLSSDELDRLVAASQHIRDFVMHWDDKRDDPATRLVVSSESITLTAPSGRRGKRPLTTWQIPWVAFLDLARTLHHWASTLLLSEVEAGAGQ